MHFELPYSNYLVRIYEKSSTSYYVKAIPLPSGLKKNFSKKEEKENSLKTCVSKFDFKKLKAINVLISNDKAFLDIWQPISESKMYLQQNFCFRKRHSSDRVNANAIHRPKKTKHLSRLRSESLMHLWCLPQLGLLNKLRFHEHRKCGGMAKQKCIMGICFFLECTLHYT